MPVTFGNYLTQWHFIRRLYQNIKIGKYSISGPYFFKKNFFFTFVNNRMKSAGWHMWCIGEAWLRTFACNVVKYSWQYNSIFKLPVLLMKTFSGILQVRVLLFWKTCWLLYDFTGALLIGQNGLNDRRMIKFKNDKFPEYIFCNTIFCIVISELQNELQCSFWFKKGRS